MIHILYAWCLRPIELWCVRFDYHNQERTGNYLNIFRKNVWHDQGLNIFQELQESILEHKKDLEVQNLYYNAKRMTSKNKVIKGHFLFRLKKNTLHKIFRVKYNVILGEDYAIQTNDIMRVAISDQTRIGGLVTAGYFNTKVTSAHYVTQQRDFKIQS